MLCIHNTLKAWYLQNVPFQCKSVFASTSFINLIILMSCLIRDLQGNQVQNINPLQCAGEDVYRVQLIYQDFKSSSSVLK